MQGGVEVKEAIEFMRKLPPQSVSEREDVKTRLHLCYHHHKPPSPKLNWFCRFAVVYESMYDSSYNSTIELTA
jgi:hypothetical protein